MSRHAMQGFLLVFALGLVSGSGQSPPASGSAADKGALRIEQDQQTRAIHVYREGGKEPILTQNAIPDNRPYLHPIVAPDGKGLLTEYRPSHHLHQTGIFWGFKLVNGRDFFMKWQAENYRRVSANTIQQRGQQVKWQTVYDMLDENGNVVMTETQNWAMSAPGSRYVLDLEWRGEAKTDITLAKYYVGGLFVRIPWHVGSRAEAVNAIGQRDKDTEQQRAVWMDVGIQVEGRDDLAHIVVFDHPDNYGFPVPWRVDSQMGFGPNLEWAERRIEKGKTEVIRYRLLAYAGDLDPVAMIRAWKEFVKEY
jgi:Methane oxygenase PmoA